MVREEGPLARFRAVKGAFHVPVSSSCTSGKKGTGVGGWEPARATPRNQSSSLEGSGHGGGFHTSPTLLAARESIAIISGSVSGTATVPEGGNCADASSPAKSDSPSDAAIDIRSSRGAPKDTDGAHLWDGPPRSSGSSAGCGVQEEWGFLGGWFPEGNALTVILRSPVSPLAATLWWGLERGSGTGTPPLCRSWSLDRNSEMVILPQWVHDSSTNAASACAKPRHVMQRSWPSLCAR